MAKRIEANGHSPSLARRASADDSAPDLEALGTMLVAALEQALLAANRLLGALDCASRDQASAATHQAQLLRLLMSVGPYEAVGQPACCGTGDVAGAIHAPAAHSATAGLTRREEEVLRLLAAGQSNQRIAHLLCLSPRTVQRHIANLYPKVGAHNRAEATAYALRHGLT